MKRNSDGIVIGGSILKENPRGAKNDIFLPQEGQIMTEPKLFGSIDNWSNMVTIYNGQLHHTNTTSRDKELAIPEREYIGHMDRLYTGTAEKPFFERWQCSPDGGGNNHFWYSGPKQTSGGEKFLIAGHRSAPGTELDDNTNTFTTEVYLDKASQQLHLNGPTAGYYVNGAPVGGPPNYQIKAQSIEHYSTPGGTILLKDNYQVEAGRSLKVDKIQSTTTNGNIALEPNGTGLVSVSSKLTCFSVIHTDEIQDLTSNGLTIAPQNDLKLKSGVNKNIELDAQGTGRIKAKALIKAGVEFFSVDENLNWISTAWKGDGLSTTANLVAGVYSVLGVSRPMIGGHNANLDEWRELWINQDGNSIFGNQPAEFFSGYKVGIDGKLKTTDNITITVGKALETNKITSAAVNGNINLEPNGTGVVYSVSDIQAEKKILVDEIQNRTAFGLTLNSGEHLVLKAGVNKNIELDAQGDGKIQAKTLVKGGMEFYNVDESTNWIATAWKGTGVGTTSNLVAGVLNVTGERRPIIGSHNDGLTAWDNLWVNPGGLTIFGETAGSTFFGYKVGIIGKVKTTDDIVFKNLGTITNTATVDRTYTFPDKSGTVALLDDIVPHTESLNHLLATFDQVTNVFVEYNTGINPAHYGSGLSDFNTDYSSTTWPYAVCNVQFIPDSNGDDQYGFSTVKRQIIGGKWVFDVRTRNTASTPTSLAFRATFIFSKTFP